MRSSSLGVLLLLALPVLTSCCPFISWNRDPPSDLTENRELGPRPLYNPPDYNDVKKDIVGLVLYNDQEFWPSDFGNYGPLLIRLAWHCAGSYRESDGRGGCDGGRIRFSPEFNWIDNANLDKALTLLQPIKLKYPNLSWGDLITLAGNTAIEAMGGPALGFCGGRVDDSDGSASLELGPTPEQERVAPCHTAGNCTFPLGTTTIGLIYLNAAGPMGEPDLRQSAIQVREVFTRMGFNDSETVALIGGGHSFGKAHGACDIPIGPGPEEAPCNPWQGKCGNGNGEDTYTSGFEGTWTTNPTKWDFEYFSNLVNYNWQLSLSPGNAYQWMPVAKTGTHKAHPVVPRNTTYYDSCTHRCPIQSSPNHDVPCVFMLTTDVALLLDTSYRRIVHSWSTEQGLCNLNQAFASAWYKLMTRDMGPISRCLGDNVPPPQPFQEPLPAPPTRLARFRSVRHRIRDLVEECQARGDALATQLVYLAWQCMSTFRNTDRRGGCNGARIRFQPNIDWPGNEQVPHVLKKLSGIKEEFGDRLTWADLIVLSGSHALQMATDGDVKFCFCGGRSDAIKDSNIYQQALRPRDYYSSTVDAVRDSIKIMGLTNRQYVALQGRLRRMHPSTHQTHTVPASEILDNRFFSILIENRWECNSVMGQYKAIGKDIYVTPEDMALLWAPELKAFVQEFAADNAVFLKEFVQAWTLWMNADRFDGPTGNLCKYE